MTDKVLYWLEIADYDLDTARDMLKAKRYVYVGFMCHQAVEKAMKAVVASTGVFPPKIHNLKALAEKAGCLAKMSPEQIAFLVDLTPMNLETRCPEEKKKIYDLLTASYSKEILRKTEEFLCWIKAML